MDSTTSKQCADWFVGQYCESCFAKVEQAMKAARVNALLPGVIEELNREKQEHESERKGYDPDSRQYRWHEGVEHGIQIALDKLTSD